MRSRARALARGAPFALVAATALAMVAPLVVTVALAQPPTAPSATPRSTPSTSTEARGAAPRALVVVTSTTTLDAFVPAFTYELVAAALREVGFEVVPPQVAGAALRADERGEACATDHTCLRALARSIGAGSVVSVVLTGPREAVARAGHVGTRELQEHAIVVSNDRELAEALQAVARTVSAAAAPCRVVLEARGVAPRWRLDGESISGPEVFVSAGEHTLEGDTSGRAGWRGTLRCEGGRGLRVRAR